MTDTTTTPRIEQMNAAIYHALAALETAEDREGAARAMWQTASDNSLRMASTLALASIAESLASIDLTLVQLNGIVLQAEDDLNRVDEGIGKLEDTVNTRLTCKTGEDVADLMLRLAGEREA